MKTENRAYGKLREIVERHCGTMIYQGTGFHGAWVISLNGNEKVLKATGKTTFPDLDKLYVPKVVEPTTWNDRHDRLLDDAEEKFLEFIFSKE